MNASTYHLLVVDDGTQSIDKLYSVFKKTSNEKIVYLGFRNDLTSQIKKELVNISKGRIAFINTAAIMKEMNLTVPNFKIKQVDPETAQSKMGYSKVQVDISQCDTIGDAKPTLENLKITLTSIDKAITQSLTVLTS